MSNVDLYTTVLNILQTTNGTNEVKARIITTFVNERIVDELILELLKVRRGRGTHGKD
jgi:hypothetical protein